MLACAMYAGVTMPIMMRGSFTASVKRYTVFWVRSSDDVVSTKAAA